MFDLDGRKRGAADAKRSGLVETVPPQRSGGLARCQRGVEDDGIVAEGSRGCGGEGHVDEEAEPLVVAHQRQMDAIKGAYGVLNGPKQRVAPRHMCGGEGSKKQRRPSIHRLPPHRLAVALEDAHELPEEVTRDVDG